MSRDGHGCSKDVCGLLGTTHLHRFAAFGPADATGLEASNAKNTKSYVDCRVRFGRPVCCSSFVLIAFIVPRLDLDLGSLTNKNSASSVTVISIIRLVEEYRRDIWGLWYLVTVLSNVEVNISIICGQYKRKSSGSNSRNDIH